MYSDNSKQCTVVKKQSKWKNRSERRKHCARAGCSKVEPKKIAPLQTPFPGAQDGQNLISWRRSHL